MSHLLDAAFLRQLEALRRRLDSPVRSGAAGSRGASRRGSGSEFREHRSYAPGDDLRRVDWMAYARSGEPVLKLQHAEEDRVVRLLLDASASLDFGNPNKLSVARKLCAAVGYLSLANAERAALFVARAEGVSGLADAFPARRGRAAFANLCRELEGVTPGGRTELSSSIRTVVDRSKRPGILAIFSDFLDSGPVLEALERARAAGHEIWLIQILDSEELEPHLEGEFGPGDFGLEDIETGARIETTMDASTLAAYTRQLEALFERLRFFCRKNGGRYVRTSSDGPLPDVIRRLVSNTLD